MLTLSGEVGKTGIRQDRDTEFDEFISSPSRSTQGTLHGGVSSQIGAYD
jgi:hypothetical protein